ncbi:MAG: SRPBCC family protein [Aggregatilineales bacterium]
MLTIKYTTELTINLPREKVIELFDSADNLKKWQPGLQSFEPISGTPGQPGAKSRLVYDMNGRKMELIETIITRNLPEEISLLFETNGVNNINTSRFYEDNGKTRWVTEDEFNFTGWMKILGWFMPGAFRKESKKTMEQFKTFAENHG